MKEIKYIIHAFLLLSANAILFLCLKAISIASESDPVSKDDFPDTVKNSPQIPLRGKQLFMANCASCHIINKNFTGPSLCGFEDRGPWGEQENVYQWIRNPQEFMKKSEYTKELKENYSGAMMTAYPNLTNEEIDEIINYINTACITAVSASL
jgi:mono/diheme cytochrome c family protein